MRHTTLKTAADVTTSTVALAQGVNVAIFVPFQESKLDMLQQQLDALQRQLAASLSSTLFYYDFCIFPNFSYSTYFVPTTPELSKNTLYYNK